MINKKWSLPVNFYVFIVASITIFWPLCMHVVCLVLKDGTIVPQVLVVHVSKLGSTLLARDARKAQLHHQQLVASQRLSIGRSYACQAV